MSEHTEFRWANFRTALFLIISMIAFAANAQESQKYLNVLAMSGLNMRVSPDVRSRIIANVPYGKRVEVLRPTKVSLRSGWIEANWYEVGFHGRKGFVFGGYLSTLPAPSTGSNASGSKLLLPVYCEQLNQLGKTVESVELEADGDSARYHLQKFEGGYELETEQEGERTTTKLTMPVSVAQSYVLLEALMKVNGRGGVLDKLIFIKDKDGSLKSVKTADGALGIRAVSAMSSEIQLTSFEAEASTD